MSPRGPGPRVGTWGPARSWSGLSGERALHHQAGAGDRQQGHSGRGGACLAAGRLGWPLSQCSHSVGEPMALCLSALRGAHGAGEDSLAGLGGSATFWSEQWGPGAPASWAGETKVTGSC